MSKKGVSAEEKQSRLLQLFYERGECFQLKELEKIAPKEKGIIANSIKGVVQKLVDDGLIDSDKIGSSIYYWAFPSKALNSKKRKLNELQTQLDMSRKKLQTIEKTIAASKENSDKDIRKKILEEINDKELELHESKKKLKVLQDNDPEKYQAIVQNTLKLKDAANRWTDNMFTVKSWCKKKFFLEDSILNKQLGIPEDFDYIE